ncbi:AraC family transcriptional regulator [Rhizobium sp. CFBP 8762]|uniref:AraC family transcriptional regulator n=1 Tax=Rhizobium sp. CFBP 8762 TaxID=2775279 RepID=UPI00177AA09C|nr:AraC family transcriptional regulator [Rhizobium sp. CFBP 8762]MBD8554366.1 AraC family transcriptional regulator [Rhizobium sp. CFBP 8762]
MLDDSSKTLPRSVADPLSEMLRGLRLDGIEYGRCQPCDPWATAFAAHEQARFHFVAAGQCWLQTPSGEWMELRTGDALLLPRGDAHVLASRPGVPPLPFEQYGRKSVCDGIFDLECAETNGKTLLFFGSMSFNVDRMHPLLQMMPEVLRTSDLAVNEPAIPHLLDAMAREVEMDRVGAGGILTRLADVLTATLIRTWVEHGCGDSSGWLAAVRNPQIGRVLAAIHLEPERDWTVDELAERMGASRSGFAQRFAALVGETPARYVARTRMTRAHQWLREGARVSVVAEQLGYESDASFSRAFKRIMGAPPSQFRDKTKPATGDLATNFCG